MEEEQRGCSLWWLVAIAVSMAMWAAIILAGMRLVQW